MVADGGGLSRDGYVFAGWNTAADGSGTAYAAGATFTFAADTTLYAQWTVPQPAATSGSLRIKKTVAGYLADTRQSFNFTVTFGSRGSYKYTGSKSGIIKSGDIIQLSDGRNNPDLGPARRHGLYGDGKQICRI